MSAPVYRSPNKLWRTTVTPSACSSRNTNLTPDGAVSFKNKGGKVRSGNGEMTGKIHVWWEISGRGKEKTARNNSGLLGNFQHVERKRIPIKFPLPSYANFLQLGETYSSSILLTNEGWELAWLAKFENLKCFHGSNHRAHTEWQLSISGVHSIVMEKTALTGEGGGCTPTRFH
jgi:hypothetical protein